MGGKKQERELTGGDKKKKKDCQTFGDDGTKAGVAVWSSRLLRVSEISHNDDVKTKMLMCRGGFAGSQTPRALTHHGSLSAQEVSQTAGRVYICALKKTDHA